ncbi:LysM peptidoglycan-binding domain-containing protein [Novilysobacter erysipheiresistens]|uniref:N-acetylmuramidase domain-containing protein n=1 Tax=Novilysobacter erysipheiresistens TaxID=1749332 RepID=A0ABU7YWH5_9GAMM|nr:N-acetylmuramidase domain-containing protein [Nitrobacter sp.]
MNTASSYTVVHGDNLTEIAAAHGTTVQDLAKLNGITDANRIQVGQTIRLRADFSQVQATMKSTARIHSRNPSIQFVLLDKLLESIQGLSYRVVLGPSEKISFGSTSEHGLTCEVTGRSGDSVDFFVKRQRGGFKHLYRTTLGDQRKVVTAYSPSIKVKADTKIHDGALGIDAGAGRDEKGHPVIVIDKKDVQLDFLGPYDGTQIQDEDFIAAADKLGCEVAAVKAVAVTETGTVGSFFDFEGWDPVPAILFERHYFHQLTNGMYDDTHPDISDRFGGGYGKYRVQYKKLLRAYNLNASAALKSASWGKFQIMGRWHEQAGYSSVEEFVVGISTSEKNHLKAFVSFIEADSRLSSAIVKKDWLAFAKTYNGPRQKGYDKKMQDHYNAFAR